MEGRQTAKSAFPSPSKSPDVSVPVPVSETVCGLPDAVSLTLREAARGPVPVGVNVTLIMQFNPGPRVAGLIGQAVAPVLVALKSPLFVPVVEMLAIISGALPVLLNVTL